MSPAWGAHVGWRGYVAVGPVAGGVAPALKADEPKERECGCLTSPPSGREGL